MAWPEDLHPGPAGAQGMIANKEKRPPGGWEGVGRARCFAADSVVTAASTTAMIVAGVIVSAVVIAVVVLVTRLVVVLEGGERGLDVRFDGELVRRIAGVEHRGPRDEPLRGIEVEGDGRGDGAGAGGQGERGALRPARAGGEESDERENEELLHLQYLQRGAGGPLDLSFWKTPDPARAGHQNFCNFLEVLSFGVMRLTPLEQRRFRARRDPARSRRSGPSSGAGSRCRERSCGLLRPREIQARRRGSSAGRRSCRQSR